MVKESVGYLNHMIILIEAKPKKQKNNKIQYSFLISRNTMLSFNIFLEPAKQK